MEIIKHWAESLEAGDKVSATIRHQTDGSLNRHNVRIIVVSVNSANRSIIGYDGHTELSIPFNELRESVAEPIEVSTIIKKIMMELERAETKHPEWPTDIIHQAAIVSEESGEMIREALQLQYEKGDILLLKEELIQTAAMCVRMLKNLPQ